MFWKPKPMTKAQFGPSKVDGIITITGIQDHGTMRNSLRFERTGYQRVAAIYNTRLSESAVCVYYGASNSPSLILPLRRNRIDLPMERASRE